MIDPKLGPVIICTKCGTGFLSRHYVAEDLRHHDNIWFVLSLRTEGPHCGGEIKIVDRSFALQVANISYGGNVS